MRQQKDWYIGTDHYVDFREKQICVERLLLETKSKKELHEEAELYYVCAGRGKIELNGEVLELRPGCFLCLYMFHFYTIECTDEPLDVIRISFYIGNFVSTYREKNPKHVNAMLVYDICPLVQLEEEQARGVEMLMRRAWEEQRTPRFGSQNMKLYLTMQLHTLHCRYALEHLKQPAQGQKNIWKLIPQILLTTSGGFTLEELADEQGITPGSLDRRIQRACGYTFFQLQKFGKILNACALLHFPELTLELSLIHI